MFTKDIASSVILTMFLSNWCSSGKKKIPTNWGGPNERRYTNIVAFKADNCKNKKKSRSNKNNNRDIPGTVTGEGVKITRSQSLSSTIHGPSHTEDCNAAVPLSRLLKITKRHRQDFDVVAQMRVSLEATNCCQMRPSTARIVPQLSRTHLSSPFLVLRGANTATQVGVTVQLVATKFMKRNLWLLLPPQQHKTDCP